MTVGVEKTREFYEGELAHAKALIEQLYTAVRWNEEQRDIQAKEIERLREKAIVDDAFIDGYNKILRENPNMLEPDCIEAMTKLQEKCERYEKALTQIEQGYNYPRMSLAEAASIARAALDGDSVN